MPLSRLNDGFEIELEGIAFGMVDRQGHKWRCLVTDRVLSDAIGGAPTQKDKTAWFAPTAVLSNESPLTNSIWAHLKKMGSSALPIGGAAVDRLLYNEATTLRRSSFRTTLITNGLLNAAGVFACAFLTPATPVLAIVALLFATETSVRRNPVRTRDCERPSATSDQRTLPCSVM